MAAGAAGQDLIRSTRFVDNLIGRGRGGAPHPRGRSPAGTAARFRQVTGHRGAAVSACSWISLCIEVAKAALSATCSGARSQAGALR